TEVIEEDNRFLHRLVSTTVLLLESTLTCCAARDRHVRTSDSTNLAQQQRHLATQVTRFDELTSMFLTVADMLVDTNAVKEIAQLELTSREWAAAIFCLTGHINRLCHDACIKLNVRPPPGSSTEPSALQRELNDITRATIRVKELVSSVLERSPFV
ncbi:hypothetical protein LSAT2_028302, partial [Lamellibrachia satsuma]